MNSEPPALRLESVTRRFGGRTATPSFVLGPITMEVGTGSWTVVSGRSGAGKSTLLHLMAGLERPDEGRTWMHGEEVSHLSGAALSDVRRGWLGVVYQRSLFIAHIPVWQNVTTRLIVEGVSARNRRRRAEEVLGEFGLSECADRLPVELSGGEQQRVSLARALVGRPRLLIADEPTSELDAETGLSLIRVFGRLWAEGTTLVIATHDPALTEKATDRIVLEHGRVCP
jgi:putative ABC transport system ATP-binding protein